MQYSLVCIVGFSVFTIVVLCFIAICYCFMDFTGQSMSELYGVSKAGSGKTVVEQMAEKKKAQLVEKLLGSDYDDEMWGKCDEFQTPTAPAFRGAFLLDGGPATLAPAHPPHVKKSIAFFIDHAWTKYSQSHDGELAKHEAIALIKDLVGDLYTELTDHKQPQDEI